MGDEGFDQFAAGTAEGFRPTEVSRIGLYKVRVKVILANQDAELIPKPGLAVAGSIGRVRADRRRSSGSSRRTREGSQLFNRTKPYSVRLAKSAIDGARFGNAQFGASYH